MGTFEVYLFKSVMTLSLMYLIYWFLLRNEIYFNLNRLFLVFSIIASLVLPFFNLPVNHIPSPTLINFVEPILNNEYLARSNAVEIDKHLNLLWILYLGGVAFFIIRFLSGLARIHFLYSRFPKYDFHGFKAIVMNSDQSPFTFFHFLFISRADYYSEEINEMIIHEKAHKDYHHSIDLLLLEILTIIQWFNPFLWLLRRSLTSEHEFFADNKVIVEGFDKADYQKLLFGRSLGVNYINVTNSFNYSLLKKRFKMMTIEKSYPLTKIKYFLSLPMLLLTIVLAVVNLNSYGQNNLLSEVDVLPKYNGGNLDQVRKFFAQNLKYPASAAENGITGIVNVQLTINENGKVTEVNIVSEGKNLQKEVIVVGYSSVKSGSGSHSVLETEIVRVAKLLTDFEPAQKDGKKVKTDLTFPFKFILN